MKILVINAGSSSLKYQLFAFHVDELVLEGGAACVDDKNFHESFSFHL